MPRREFSSGEKKFPTWTNPGDLFDQSEDVADDLPDAEDLDGFESDGLEDGSPLEDSLLADSPLAEESEAGLPLTADSDEAEVSDAFEPERA